MRLIWIFLLVSFLLLFGLLPSSAQQLDPSDKRTIVAKSGSLKDTFEVVLAFHRRQRAQEAALVYRDLWLNSPDNTRMKAQYAFAMLIQSDFFAVEADTTHQKRLRQKLNDFWYEAVRCREDSFQYLTRDPGALLMNALYEEGVANFAQSLDLAEKASALEPKWAYARYWCGKSRSELAGKIGSNKPDPTLQKQLWKQALADYQKAEEINPAFSTTTDNILYGYTSDYYDLGQYDKALQFLDKLIKVVETKKPIRKSYLARLQKLRGYIVSDRDKSS